MASSLEDDLSCPICCELYQDPHLLSCGHTFCTRCLHKHWEARSTHTCPVCRQTCLQKPVANLVLRNTCETYLKEREKNERERDGEDKCAEHGEKILLFCKTDEKAICSECRKERHSFHKVQALTQAVRQRKGRVKEALRPAEKALESLHNGTALNAQIAKYIQSQAQHAEKLIKDEFGKIHQFLREEEKARVAALKQEEVRKREKVEVMVRREIERLSDKVKDVEENMEKNGTTFLENYDTMMRRAQYTVHSSELGSETLINTAEHVGNLGYKVWEKMRDILNYYPVVLDPNTAPADFSITGDFACVRMSTQNHPCPVPHGGTRLVLGSEGYVSDTHCWDVEVGDSKHWTLGVCRRSAVTASMQLLTPEMGFWGLSRRGDSYRLLISRASSFKMSRKPRAVRVWLGWQFFLDKWKTFVARRVVSFLDPSDDSIIAYYSGLPTGVELFPFLIPEERFAPLRIAPANVVLNEVRRLPSQEKKTNILVYLLCLVLVAWIIYIYISS